MIDFGAGVRTGQGRCLVVAEIGCNHNGSLELAQRLIVESAQAGADVVKFQAYLPAELLALRGGDGPAPEPWAGMTWKELYEKAQTPLKWFPALIKTAEDAGVPWFSSVFGPGSLAFMEAMECPVYKLAALDYASRSFRRMVEATGKPIVRSSPGPRGSHFELWCPPGYPQALDGAPLQRMMKRFDGFSYHGQDYVVPGLAGAYGAQMVEVHVQADDVRSELDWHSSLTVPRLDALVDMALTVARLGP